jgi:hypothetical protein
MAVLTSRLGDAASVRVSRRLDAGLQSAVTAAAAGCRLAVISSYQPEKPLSYRGCMTAWGNLPPALPPHGTVLAWARGCRCEECEREHQRFVSELALRGPLRLPAQPEPRKLDADTLARLEPAVSQSECPVCGALRHQRCRNLAFPQHFAPTHPERASGP